MIQCLRCLFVAAAFCMLAAGCSTVSETETALPAGGDAVLAAGTPDGLAMRFKADGSLAELDLKGTKLPVRPAPLFWVRETLPPDGRQGDWKPVTATASPSEGGVAYAGTWREDALEVTARISTGAFVDVVGELRDLTGRDRAVRLRFTLPANLLGHRWESTPAHAATIEAGRSYPSQPNEMIYLDRVGPRKNRPPTESGLPVNRLPYTVVAGKDSALALAYPVHEPRAFLVQAAQDGLSITFTLGLTPLTKKLPSRASFRFILYPVDPAWGIRSAAEKYMGFFPELYASANRRHGNYVVLPMNLPQSKRKWPDRAEDFGYLFAENDFQWAGGEMNAKTAEDIQRLNLLPFHWRGPWYWFHAVPRGISQAEQLALLKAQAEGRKPGAHGTNNQLLGCPDRTSALGAYHSYLLNERGQLDRQHYPRGYNSYLMPMNMNPDLPKPNRAWLATDWQYRFFQRWDDPAYRGPRNFAWDALDDWGGFRRLNFRREHFQYESVPLVFDAESGRLCILNGFTHWAFARLHSGMVRGKQGLIMANCNREQAMLLCGQFLDVIVKERAAKSWNDEGLVLERLHVGQKPIAFIGGLQPPSGPELEATLRRLLRFGMMPGATGRDEQRDLMKKYMPVIIRVAEAGWHPLTHAQAEGLAVERFGEQPGSLYFTVANLSAQPVAGSVVVDLAGLNLRDKAGRLKVTERVEKRSVNTAIRGGKLEIGVQVEPGETLVLAIGERDSGR